LTTLELKFTNELKPKPRFVYFKAYVLDGHRTAASRCRWSGLHLAED